MPLASGAGETALVSKESLTVSSKSQSLSESPAKP